MHFSLECHASAHEHARMKALIVSSWARVESESDSLSFDHDQISTTGALLVHLLYRQTIVRLKCVKNTWLSKKLVIVSTK